MMYNVILFTLNCLLGGIVNTLLWCKKWSEVKSYDGLKGIILGGIGGYVFCWAYSEWSIPNGIAAFV
ncbi:MAG: hypothetical protein ACUVQ8_00010 [Nitrososphaeria archaeon]